MNIVLGATGQVGSMLVKELLEKGEVVRAVVRNKTKALKLEKLGAEVYVADYFDKAALKHAFQGGHTVFLLTPENPESKDGLADTRTMLANYREAILATDLKKIVGLSSMGAQHKSGTGNLVASYLLEHAFSDIGIEQIFVRPAYYFSNWMGNLELVEKEGVLPTFFPLDLRLPMIAPQDVAKFVAETMINQQNQAGVYEISGPKTYTPVDIGQVFGAVLNKEVTVQQILPNEWEDLFLQIGFSENGAKNLIDMTQASIDGKTESETGNVLLQTTDFETYLRNWRMENG